MTAKQETTYANFADFYPFYLGEHSNAICRGLHYVGTSLAMLILVLSLLTANYVGLLGAALCGYGFAWVGHFFLEHNRPATFKHPFYSLMGDYLMLFQALTGRLDHKHFKNKKE